MPTPLFSKIQEWPKINCSDGFVDGMSQPSSGKKNELQRLHGSKVASREVIRMGKKCQFMMTLVRNNEGTPAPLAERLSSSYRTPEEDSRV